MDMVDGARGMERRSGRFDSAPAKGGLWRLAARPCVEAALNAVIITGFMGALR
ncbi:hypothetical protein [Paracidovorax wautersii]|uniref:hypothetical protein n=1 Tax=Paracidovorax wautersii TaxID=1177982 RepID=UPI0015876996|nr:hypothetical protein [Paracidovorax wautersii]